eukprot:jgi/Tetstr1/438035/TSEL_026662.t2
MPRAAAAAAFAQATLLIFSCLGGAAATRRSTLEANVPPANISMAQTPLDRHAYSGWRDKASAQLRRQMQEQLPCDEFSLCGNQVLRSSVESGIDLATCLFDADMELWLCGDHIISQEVYTLLYSETCISGCIYAPEFLDRSISSSLFYWEMGEWRVCSSLCGGGTQTRRVHCRQKENNTVVANSNCDGDRPPFLRACNQIPCEMAELQFREVFSEFSSCSTPCGGGLREQPVLCAATGGFLVSQELCSMSPGADAISSCNMQACASYRWELGPWSACTVPCGGGFMERPVRCLGPDNVEVDPELCPGYEPSREACNSAPCSPGAWYVLPWGECVPDNGECGVGAQTRPYPNCLDRERGMFSLDCRKPGPPTAASCHAAQRCEESCGMDCHGHGTCQGGVCLCEPGRRGQFCEMSAQVCPAGVLDSAGACCPAGVVDRSGTCCGDSAIATLDRDGECCSSGKLDAFGACGGSAKYVGVSGLPCQGLLDAAGACCSSGAVDECGVCDGHGASCGMRLVVAVLQQPEALPSGAADSVRLPLPEGVMTRFFLGTLGIEPWQFTLEYAESFAQSDTEAGIMQEGYRLQMRLVPPSSALERVPLTTGDATLRLTNAQGSPIGSQFFLGSATQVVRVPICGNGICEAGERALAGATPDATTCSQDCGHAYAACPAVEGFGGERLICSGRGICESAAGVCTCFRAHRGAACEKCAPGFVMHGGVCVYQSNAQGATGQGATLTASVSSILLSIAAGAGVAIFIILVYTVAVKRKFRFLPFRRGDKPEDPAAAAPDPSRNSVTTPAHSEVSPHGSFAPGHSSSIRALEGIMHQSGCDSQRSRSSPFASAARTPLSAPNSSRTIGGRMKQATSPVCSHKHLSTPGLHPVRSEPGTPGISAMDPDNRMPLSPQTPSSPRSVREMLRSKPDGAAVNGSLSNLRPVHMRPSPNVNNSPSSSMASSPRATRSPWAEDDSPQRSQPAWKSSPVKGLASMWPGGRSGSGALPAVSGNAKTEQMHRVNSDSGALAPNRKILSRKPSPSSLAPRSSSLPDTNAPGMRPPVRRVLDVSERGPEAQAASRTGANSIPRSQIWSDISLNQDLMATLPHSLEGSSRSIRVAAPSTEADAEHGLADSPGAEQPCLSLEMNRDLSLSLGPVHPRPARLEVPQSSEIAAAEVGEDAPTRSLSDCGSPQEQAAGSRRTTARTSRRSSHRD